MPVKVRTIMAILLLFMTFVSLQGCGSAGGGGGGTSGEGQNVDLSLSTPNEVTSITADGTSSTTLQMLVTNASGAAMANTPVTFSTDLGTLSAVVTTAGINSVARSEPEVTTRQTGADGSSVTVNTDANGLAQVTLTASGTAGTARITVDVLGFRTSTTIEFTAGPPAQVTLSADPTTVGLGGTANLDVTVTDANNNPVSEQTVTLSLTTDNTGGSLSAESGVTGTDGRASLFYVAGFTAGMDTLSVATSNGITATVDITVTEETVTDQQLIVTPNPGSIPADGTSTSTITAVMVNDTNNPIIGSTVTFTTSLGTITASAVTDDTGRATATLISSTTEGPAVVTATSGSLSDTTTVSFASPAAGNVASIAVSVTESSGTADDNTITADGSTTATITATLQDATGDPVSDGTIVNFSTDLGAITSQDTTTNGIAAATFTAGTVSGNAVVTVTSGSITTTVILTLEAGPAANIVLISISDTSIGVRGSGSNETSNLTFEVRDSNGNLAQDPIPGQTTGTTVRFTLENGGISGGESLSPSAATAVNGQATTTVQSGTLAGTVRVAAFIDADNDTILDAGEITSEAIGIVITGGSPWGEHLSVVPEVLNIAGLVTLGLTDPITTFLSDRFSNPVPDGTATFLFSDFAGVTGSAVSSSDSGAMAATTIATLTSQGPLPPDGFVTVTSSTQSGAESRILSLAVDPTNADVVYAGTDGGGVFRTPNGRATGSQVAWEQVGAPQLSGSGEVGFTSGVVHDLQIDPSNSSIIYAATDHGVFRSTGGGDTWSQRSGRERVEGRLLGQLQNDAGRLGFFQVLSLPFPSNGSRARTVVEVNGVETTFYTYVGATLIDILPIPGRAVNDFITVSYDLGASIPSDFPVSAIALDPTNPLTDPANTRALYASTRGGGIFRSSNGGFSWGDINNNLINFDVLSVVALSSTTLYAGTNGDGIFRTFNATATVPIWCQVNNGLVNASVINTLATDSTRVYAGTRLGGVAFLTDGTPPAGETDCRNVVTAPTWTAPTTNVNASNTLNTLVTDIVVDPTNTVVIYATTLGDGTRSIESNAAQGGVFRSDDSGVTWTRIPALATGQLGLPPTDLPDNRAYAIGLPAIANTDTVYIGTAGRSVIRLTPSTAAFEVSNGTPNNAITNNIFGSTRVLFSGNTRVTITQVSDIFRDTDRTRFGSLPDSTVFNTGAQTFFYTVSDQNGNPLTAGSTVVVTVDPSGVGAELAGNVSFTIPDTQQGSTDFAVSLLNNREETGNEVVSINIDVTSVPNGSVTASTLRTIIGPTAVVALSGITIPGKGTGAGGFSFQVIGGSETTMNAPLNGGYTIGTPAFGTVSPTTISFGGTFSLVTDASAQGQTFIVSATDRITGQVATLEVTQEATEPVVISPATGTLPAGGGTFAAVNVLGGSDTTYAIITTSGTLNTSTVNAGGGFTLTTTAAQNGQTVTVTAIDAITGQQGTATITQEAPTAP